MEHFLEGTVVLRYLLNKDTLSIFLQRAAIKDKNDYALEWAFFKSPLKYNINNISIVVLLEIIRIF